MNHQLSVGVRSRRRDRLLRIQLIQRETAEEDDESYAQKGPEQGSRVVGRSAGVDQNQSDPVQPMIEKESPDASDVKEEAR